MSRGHHELRQSLPSGVDESLIRQQLELSQAERIRQLDHQVREMWLLVEAGERARGERPARRPTMSCVTAQTQWSSTISV